MKFDISWSDLGAGALHAVLPADHASAQRAAERAFGGDPACNLALLSVRSGWYALLKALALPPGSRVAFSGITIKHMPQIAEHLGLKVDAFDVHPDTLAPDMASLQRTLTPDTRVIVVAHLFGARAALEPVHQLARERGLLVVEDCAQAYTGDGWQGSPDTDVAMFSFGPIKTATALGGAVFRFRSQELRNRVAAVQATWPVQGRAFFGKRVARFCGLQLLSTRPVFTLFTTTCDALRVDWDALIAKSARGFAGGDFFARIQVQPSAPLLRLLARRLQQVHAQRIACRAQAASMVLQPHVRAEVPGRAAGFHSHWVLPVRVAEPNALAAALRRRGFDATRGTSSMTVVGPAPAQQAPQAYAAEVQWLYVPCHHGMGPKDHQRLAETLKMAIQGPQSPRSAP